MLAASLSTAISAPGVAAGDWTGANGLWELAPELDPNSSGVFQQARLHAGGWLDAGFTFNTVRPSDGFNGPVTFNDLSRTPQLNQFYLYAERSVDVGSDDWDIGGRADFLFGTDGAFTQTYGAPGGTWDNRLLSDRFYQIAFPQAYVEVFAPIGTGVNLKAGHFYTIIGSESVMAPDNFFYSHSYTMQYGEPFTHTGVLASYQPVESLQVNAGAVTGSQFGGWDGAFDRNLESWGFLGGITWANAEGDSSLTVNGTHGGTRGSPGGTVSLYSVVLQHDFAAALHVKIQHDYGWLDGAPGTESAQWYSLVNYAIYDIAENVSVGLRAEWFRDNGGIRVAAPAREPALAPTPATYYGLTAGLNWHPFGWLTLRHSVRYDWSDGADAYDAGTRDAQVLLSSDLILTF